jgi:hypothetical protein
MIFSYAFFGRFSTVEFLIDRQLPNVLNMNVHTYHESVTDSVGM